MGAAVSPRLLDYKPGAKALVGKPAPGQLVVAHVMVAAYLRSCDGIAAAILAGRWLGLSGGIHP